MGSILSPYPAAVATLVKPSGDTSGATDLAALAAAISQQKNVQLLAGTYYINAALPAVTGMTLAGAGMGLTIINQTSSTAHGIAGTDVSQISIRDLELNGPSSGSGNGINIIPSANANVAYIDIENVLAGSFGNVGVHLDTPIVSHLRKVLGFSNGGDGFQISNTKGTPTSVTLDSCYAKSNGFAGYEFDSAAYCSLNGCASDSNPNGYALFSCKSVVLNGCGAEGFTTAGWVFDGCVSCHLNTAWTFNGKTTVVHVTDGTTDQTITGLTETSPASGATACIQTDAGTSAVAVNCTNVTANSFSAGTAYTITSGGGTTH